MNTAFFLGANSENGFYSLYDDFCRGENDFLYLIKGGPGTGKSSFMRTVGKACEDRGLDVEYILCSGDPQSLDGVYIPRLQLGFADATAPHALEPRLFGVNSCYVNLGDFCARVESEKIALLTQQYKSCYATAYAYLSAAGKLRKAQIPNFLNDNDIRNTEKRTKSVLKAQLGEVRRPRAGARITRRFISCISCQGKLVLEDSVKKLCKRICVLDNTYGLADSFLEEVLRGVQLRGINAIVCPSPLCPDELEAVLIPQYNLAFVTEREGCFDKPWRHIRLDALVDAERVRAHRAELKQLKKQTASLLETAYYYLNNAKAFHDKLEGEYKKFMDFEAHSEFTNFELEHILKKATD